MDIHLDALAVYARNFPHHSTWVRLIETLPASVMADWNADLWWLSPPCQPFTRRGRQRDEDDPRSRAFLAVLRNLAEVRPPYVALENVPGFLGSRVHGRLRQTLAGAGYEDVHERLLCPSRFGVPNRRQRYYLVASRRGLAPRIEAAPPAQTRGVRSYLDAEPDPELDVQAELLRRYEGALHLVDPDDPSALTNCFTSAYGRSPVRSGSYLATERGARHFSPSEILRFLGFPPTFSLPPEMPRAKAWRLVGNSLSFTPVQAMLAGIPELRTFFRPLSS